MDDVRFTGETPSSVSFDRAKLYSWTWRVPDHELRRAIGVVRAWAEERHGDLNAPLESEVPSRWRAYDLP